MRWPWQPDPDAVAASRTLAVRLERAAARLEVGVELLERIVADQRDQDCGGDDGLDRRAGPDGVVR